MKYFVVCALSASVVLGACNGQLYSEGPGSGNRVKGIVAYQQQHVVEEREYRAVVESGKVVRTHRGRSDDTRCVPTKIHEVALRSDYSRPYRIWYEAGFLETNKFGVTLKDGVLVAVNTESQPDRGETIKNLAESLTSVAPILGLAPSAAGVPVGEVPCTHLPQLVGVFRLPDSLSEFSNSD